MYPAMGIHQRRQDAGEDKSINCTKGLMMTPFFSIIVPCCDVEPYLRESLDSVLR